MQPSLRQILPLPLTVLDFETWSAAECNTLPPSLSNQQLIWNPEPTCLKPAFGHSTFNK